MRDNRLAIVQAVVPGLFALALLVSSCATPPSADPRVHRVESLVAEAQRQFAPDRRMHVFNVGVEPGRELVLTGEVDRVEVRQAVVRACAAARLPVRDAITVLPTAELGDRTNGIAILSVASAREQPHHMAEMGTQILLGHSFKVLKAVPRWYLVQAVDGYLAWLEQGTFLRCTGQEVQQWQEHPLLIITALEDIARTEPLDDAEPLSDLVIGDLVENLGESGAWWHIALPDGRKGYVRKSSAENYAAWRGTRAATAESIEKTARQFLGRPYLWGGNSPKGLDCSGLTQLTFFLNGIELPRNASQQARVGLEVSLNDGLSQLVPGDLLFFGHRADGSQPARIVHVGIYLGNKLFIHSSERVHISSLDPAAPNRDEHRIKNLIQARRVLP